MLSSAVGLGVKVLILPKNLLQSKPVVIQFLILSTNSAAQRVWLKVICPGL